MIDININILWNSENFHPSPNSARTTPFLVILLDQLYHFSSRFITANVVAYTDFQWYRNIFGINLAVQNALHRINPNLADHFSPPKLSLILLVTFGILPSRASLVF